MKTLLWLDDLRNPFKLLSDGSSWLVFSPIENPNVVWCKDYNDFTTWITTNGLPDGICFDHDLSDFQAFKSGFPDMVDGIDYTNERTGYDCAKWLVDYCMDNDKDLPLWNVQSANPTGKDNINGLLNNYKKFRNSGV